MIDKETGMCPKEQLGERIATLAARIDAATYELLVLIREFDEKGCWDNGFLSCAQWLSWRVGFTPGTARERVRVAHALGDLPLMSEAMKRGELSYSKVRALTRIATAETEESLVILGRSATAAHIERVVSGWRRIDRMVEASDDEMRDATSRLSTDIDENGMFVIRGRLAPEVGEVLMKALDAAGEKLYAKRDQDEPRKMANRPSVGKVRADALGLVAEAALKAGLDAGSSGDRYQVVVHVNEDELRDPEAEAPCRCSVPAGTSVGRQAVVDVSAETCAGRNGGGLAATDHVSAETVGNAGTGEGRAEDRVPVEASAGCNGHGAHASDSVSAETSFRAGTGREADVGGCVSAETPDRPVSPVCGAEHRTDGQPRGGGDQARGALPGAWLGASHVPVSAETARRIACDAGRVVMKHASGEILSVGRKTRTIPPPIRRALEFRDRGCRFPGCTSRHCDAHHVVHWADGGETKLSNLVLLCRRHHRLLHEGRFTVCMDDQGAVQFHHPRGRPLQECPAPPPVGLDAVRELAEHLEDAGIVITGEESMPNWDGQPMDLRYVLECVWRPPPHLEEVVARERSPSRVASDVAFGTGC